MFKIKGTFQAQTITTKEGSKGPYKVGEAIIKVDQSYEDPRTGEQVVNLSEIPFNVIGRAAEFVETLQYDQEVEINFEIKGREYNGKYYSQLRAVSIKPVGELKAKAPDIQF